MPNPFVHIELNTDDVNKAKKFYKAVFAWNIVDVPAMKYSMIDVGVGVGGGMGKKSAPEAPTAWLPYVEVDDVKKTVAKARSAGAKVLLDYMSIGDMGAIGIFVDPTGAQIGVWEKGKAAAEPAKKVAKKAAKKAAKPAKKAGKKKSAKKR
jgi:predicted enzyme related to lactoylglutathione lyase